MQASRADKLQFYTSIVLFYACILALVWCVSPIPLFKPDTTVYGAPVVQVKKLKPMISGTPSRVVVPSVGIDLPVTNGVYDAATGQWTIASRKAFYATPTPPLNDQSGTTLIYGHNNHNTFRDLRDLVPGAELLVYADNGTVFHYTYTEAHEVQPDDTSLLTYSGQPSVMLQTCSGNWNEFRKLFHFQLVSVDPASNHV